MVARLRVIEGRPWRNAVICAVSPKAPYRPWRLPDLKPGDSAIVVLDTDPRTVLCTFTVGSARGVRRNIAERSGGRTLRIVAEVEHAAGGFALADWDGTPADSPAALALVESVRRFEPSMPLDRAGDSSVAAGRMLLASYGRCTCCGAIVDFAREPDELQVRPVSVDDVASRRDWPAALCADCSAAMHAAQVTSVVDFMYSRHPACPFCSARRTRKVSYGRAGVWASQNSPPWDAAGGCAVGDEGEWNCGACQYSWGTPTPPWIRS
jgi:hypothetical protein